MRFDVVGLAAVAVAVAVAVVAVAELEGSVRMEKGGDLVVRVPSGNSFVVEASKMVLRGQGDDRGRGRDVGETLALLVDKVALLEAKVENAAQAPCRCGGSSSAPNTAEPPAPAPGAPGPSPPGPATPNNPSTSAQTTSKAATSTSTTSTSTSTKTTAALPPAAAAHNFSAHLTARQSSQLLGWAGQKLERFAVTTPHRKGLGIELEPCYSMLAKPSLANIPVTSTCRVLVGAASASGDVCSVLCGVCVSKVRVFACVWGVFARAHLCARVRV